MIKDSTTGLAICNDLYYYVDIPDDDPLFESESHRERKAATLAYVDRLLKEMQELTAPETQTEPKTKEPQNASIQIPE